MGLNHRRQCRYRLGVGTYQRPGTLAAKAGLTVAVAALVVVGGVPNVGPTGQRSFGRAAYADWQPSDTGKLVDIDLTNADLQSAVAILQNRTGADIEIREGTHPYGRVNLHLHNASIRKVLDHIGTSANAVITQESDGVYLVRPLEDVPATVAPVPSRGNYHLYRIALQHAVPNDVLYLMQWDQDVRKFDVYAQLNATPGISVTNSSASVTMVKQDGTPVIPERGTVGANEVNRSTDQSGNVDQQHQYPDYGGPGGFPGGFPNQGNGFGGNQFPGGAGGAGQPGGTGGLPEGVEHIYALQGNNVLLVYGTPEGYNRVKDIVKELDVAPKQVQIKVEFVTATVGDVDAFGINYTLVPFPGVSASSALPTPGAPTYQLNFAAGNLVAQMESQLTRSTGKVVQSPMITTTNNTPATISFTQQIPYTTTTNIIPGGGGTAVANTQQAFLNLTTGLNVTPRRTMMS